MKRSIYILLFVLGTCHIGCLKDVKTEFNHDNIFDPEWEGEQWFQFDSAAPVGFGYNCYFTIINEQLLSGAFAYNVRMRRIGDPEYYHANLSNSKFDFYLEEGHLVGGKYYADIGVSGSQDTTQAIFHFESY